MGFILLVFASLVSVSAGYSQAYASEASTDEYLSIGPDIIVNLQGRRRYLRVQVDLMIEGEAHVQKIRTHIPALRHELIMLFSGYDPKQLATVEQREGLRQSALQAAVTALAAYGSSTGLKDLYFGSFLVQ